MDSILGQTFRDFEVILLDDCSTDGSRAILQEYAGHPKVSHVVVNETNSGSTFRQWDLGFSLAEGQYIWIAESDDWCEATLLETLVPELENDSNVTLAFCQCQLVDESGKLLYRTSADAIGKVVDGRDFVAGRMFGDMVIVNAGMAVFRKSVLDGIDQDYKTMKGTGDWRFWVEVALKGKVFVSGKTLAYCFRHSGTVTSASVASGRDIEEGNRVFNAVMHKCSPSKTEITVALKQRIRIYLDQRKQYLGKDIEKRSRQNIMGLHPDARRLYLKIRIKNAMRCLFR